MLKEYENAQKNFYAIGAEIAKREASPAFDQFYFDYEKGLKNKNRLKINMEG